MPQIAPEHYHALLVHFPVAFWSLAIVLLGLSLLPRLDWFRSVSILLGLLGSAFGYVAIETGEKAADIVAAAICNQTLLVDHNDQTQTAWIILTTVWALAFVYDLLLRKLLRSRSLPLWPTVFLFLGSILGGVFLVSGAHKGFLLVYQEGAAVQNVVRKCPQ